MKVAIVGLPNVGKSSLFNLLTGNTVHTDIYPFTTIERNIGIWELEDTRMKKLKERFKPEVLTPPRVELMDIAGLVKGASRGEGLGNRFLASIRDSDMVIHLLRNFKSDIPHVEEEIDPCRDKELVETEIMLADYEIVKKMMKKLRFPKDKDEEEKKEILERLAESIEKVEKIELSPEDREKLKGTGIISIKPFLYLLNTEEYKEDLDCLDGGVQINVKLEYEIKDMEDREELRRAYGFQKNPLLELSKKTKEKLNLITFYTVKGKETRAYLIKKGTTLIEAVRKIHSDMAKGFIKADVINYTDIDKQISPRVEGKDYIVQDGDIITVKFRV